MFRHYPNICLKALNKTMKKPVYGEKIVFPKLSVEKQDCLTHGLPHTWMNIIMPWYRAFTIQKSQSTSLSKYLFYKNDNSSP